MAKKRKIARRKKILPLVFLAFVALLVIYFLIRSIQPNIFLLPELSTAGFTEVGVAVNITDDRGVVYLANQCYELSAVVERSQAVSISNGLNKIVGPRPNTHDLFNDMLKNLKIKVLMVKIVDLRESAYIGRLVLKQGNLILSLDSRPSDAIAVAARTDYMVPIYINETLLKAVGKKIC